MKLVHPPLMEVYSTLFNGGSTLFNGGGMFFINGVCFNGGIHHLMTRVRYLMEGVNF